MRFVSHEKISTYLINQTAVTEPTLAELFQMADAIEPTNPKIAEAIAQAQVEVDALIEELGL